MLLWHDVDRLGDLVSAMGSREFGNRFYALFRDLLAVEECTVFSFPDETRPRTMIVEGNSEAELKVARRLAEDYVAGGYRIDPNVQQQNRTMAIDIYARDPREIRDDEYRNHYYDGPNLSHELVVIGATRGTLYYASFYRRIGGKSFGREEVELARAVAGFMIKALHRHNELVHDGTDELRFTHTPTDSSGEVRQKTLTHLKDVLLSSTHKLSPREAEICAGIVMGYSTEAIGLNCSISTNTVATHRKRAYAKLGICSQNELFIRYFSVVREIQDRLEG